ncbi:hypothetical protein [Clostridium aciditolerans]|uniref:Uncharacterized protein n=1 Tax=Clostridium aciditolerans TaxID=339861 RepID=A0A934I407_9CLOT|nr:hypothetical protein [Clostridium aciditolerans]MBI6875620.1 hypothetical protein [Clostridium aciditolerans]
MLGYIVYKFTSDKKEPNCKNKEDKQVNNLELNSMKVNEKAKEEVTVPLKKIV